MNQKPLLTTLLLLLCLSSTRAQGYVDLLPDDVKNPFSERRLRITRELERSVDNEWAGNYSRYIGETWSEVFTWAPENGFAAFRDTCSNGPRAWVNYGAAKLSDGRFVVAPDRPGTAESVLELQDKEFTPIKWGEQHWLIPTNELALFAHAINSGSWEDYEAFYVKTDDIQKPRKGRPNLPPQYKRLLGLPPIKASVTQIGAGEEKWYPDMTINAGKDKGVMKGMSFWLVGLKNTEVKVSVTEVQERTASVRVVGVGFRGAETREIVPKPGWQFTSRCCPE